MRGRKPKPTRLKVVQGNPGKRPLNAGEPALPDKPPACPPHLDEEAKREWRRVLRLLGPLRLVTAADRSALAVYCQAWADWVAARKRVAEYGPILVAESGAFYQNPYLAVANRAEDRMARFLAEFGLTPSGRARLGKAATPEADPFEDFLRHGATG